MPDPGLRNVIDEVAESYEGAPPEIRELGLERLLTGLDRYGDGNFLDAHTEAEWLHEALEELLDAFNMLAGMRVARGETPIAAGSLRRAIHLVHAALLEAAQ